MSKNTPVTKELSTKKSKRVPKHLEHINLLAAGIDIGATSHFVAVPEGVSEITVREFRTFTSDLYALADWLRQCGIQQMQKALTQMNVQLHHVIADITGDTGMKIIRAIDKGKRDPAILAEHLFSLKQSLELYDYFQEKIQACDDEIAKTMAKFSTNPNVGDTPIDQLNPSKKN